MESKKRERRRLRAPSSFRMFGEGGWGLCLSNVNRRSSLALLQSFFLPRVPFHVGFEPAQDALPAFAMVGCRREVGRILPGELAQACRCRISWGRLDAVRERCAARVPSEQPSWSDRNCRPRCGREGEADRLLDI